MSITLLFFLLAGACFVLATLLWLISFVKFQDPFEGRASFLIFGLLGHAMFVGSVVFAVLWIVRLIIEWVNA